MKYIEFQNLVTTPLFTPQDLKILGATYTPSQFTGWIKKGYITKLRGSLYIFTRQLATLSPESLAPHLVTPSYLSLEYALSHFTIIPEAVHSYTSITSKTTRTITLPQGTFNYRHLPARLFFGYTQANSNIAPYNLAEPEKALLDYFYLTPSIKNSKDLHELRLNLGNIDMELLSSYAKIVNKVRVTNLIHLLTKHHYKEHSTITLQGLSL